MIPKELSERFHYSQVRKNQSNFDFVAIDDYIKRLNNVLGSNWHWEIRKWEFRDGPPTKAGKPQYIAVVSGQLTVDLPRDDGDAGIFSHIVSRDGVGAGFNFDPDTAIKTAQAEALKKACHQFGIALYLWSEEERDFVQMQREAMTDDVSLKRLVMEYTIREQGLDPNEQPSREDIIACLGIDDLTVENMRKALSDRGVL